MRVVVISLILTIVIGCCPCRKATLTTTTMKRDTVYVAHFDTVRIVERDSALLSKLDQYHDKIISTEQHSELSNVYCISTADIDEEGRLRHTLDTRDSAMLPARIIFRERLVRDTVYVGSEREETVAEVSVREVRKTTWWQKTQIIALWVLLGILAIKYHKRLINVIKKIWS